MSNDSNNSISRRRVLEGLGTGAAALGTIGSASARQSNELESATRRSLARRYESPSLSRTLVADHGRETLEMLAEHGYLEDASVDRLPLDTHFEERTAIRPESPRNGFAVTAIEADGVATAHITVSFATESHDVALYVQPERGTSYAVVVEESGREVFVHPEATEPMDDDCSYNYTCGDVCDSYGRQWNIEEKCCPGLGCETTGRTCSCQP